ncbi:MAG: hypothetical protein IJ814_09070 [Paludibacteraceae bacterium]|nr:hypothetical protein [Paludibacteraceae bacterium]
MKKSIFILSAIFAATLANAQITLEHTFNHEIDLGWGIESIHNFDNQGKIIGNYLYEEMEETINIYDANDCSLLKTISKTDASTYFLISRGIFTTDNRWSYVTYQKTNIEHWDFPDDCKYYYVIKIQTEDGEVLATLSSQALCEDNVTLLKIGDNYKLLVENYEHGYYDYYSLPGNGEAQAVSTPSSPKRSTRKITRDGQVLVQTDNNTYTLTGAEVK